MIWKKRKKRIVNNLPTPINNKYINVNKGCSDNKLLKKIMNKDIKNKNLGEVLRLTTDKRQSEPNDTTRIITEKFEVVFRNIKNLNTLSES